jgi:hypothetical protein
MLPALARSKRRSFQQAATMLPSSTPRQPPSATRAVMHAFAPLNAPLVQRCISKGGGSAAAANAAAIASSTRALLHVRSRSKWRSFQQAGTMLPPSTPRQSPSATRAMLACCTR